jgi:hypothetical protein
MLRVFCEIAVDFAAATGRTASHVRYPTRRIASSYNAVVAKALKVMISMPGDLLERVDRVAAERGTSRSAFLQDIVRRALGWPDPVAFDAAVERGRDAVRGAGAFESADLIRAERDGRDAHDRRR